ncbi:MAG: hypothetical protein JXA37_03585 [Chloroflexia bacterium]|nr:hypothetical protein [Chloroflexia bacterium]
MTTRRTTNLAAMVEHRLEIPLRRVTNLAAMVEHVLGEPVRRVTNLAVMVEYGPPPPGGICLLRCGFDRGSTFGGYTSLDGDHPSHAPRIHTHDESDISDLVHDAIRLRGREIAPTAPLDGQVLGWDGAASRWKPFPASPNPGAAPAILRTDAGGHLQLEELGSGHVEIASGGAYYLGDPDTDGSWRIIRSGTDLAIERREGGTWVAKSTISA